MEITEVRLRLGLCSGPSWESSRRSLKPPPFLVGWGWETLSFSSSMDTSFTDILLMAEVDSRPHPKLKSNTPLDVFRLLERGRTGPHQTHQTGLGLHTWSPTFETFCDA